MIQIDHGIPIPPRPPVGSLKGRCGVHKYPWATMGVGDSFVFPGILSSAQARIWGRRHYDRRRYWAFSVVEDGQTIVRVWRIE